MRLPSLSDTPRVPNVMKSYTEEIIHKLLAVCVSCTGHKTERDSYTSPAFAEYLGRPLTITDIPMSTYDYNKHTLTKEPNATPWQDSIKNFILDTTSVQTAEKFKTCILMVEYGYKYTDTGGKLLDATADLVKYKYGALRSIIITAEPEDENYNMFSITARQGNNVGFTDVISRELLVSTLMSFYIPSSTLLICHDSQSIDYQRVVSMMPSSKWSLSCTPTTFISPTSRFSTCKYICPVYSCFGSMETRAVGQGPVLFDTSGKSRSYTGKMNYYTRCIRGSRHSSGRCYDCHTLYKTLVNLGASPTASPVPMHSVAFSDSFIHSDEDDDND